MATSKTVKSVEIHWNHTELKKLNERFREGVFEMAYNMAEKARLHAPFVTGALRNSIRVEPNKSENAVYVIAGGIFSTGVEPKTGEIVARWVNYAAKREIGPNRNPETEHYMEQAQKDIMVPGYEKHYFGEISKGGNTQ